jgi:hypothetical protein
MRAPMRLVAVGGDQGAAGDHGKIDAAFVPPPPQLVNTGDHLAAQPGERPGCIREMRRWRA